MAVKPVKDLLLRGRRYGWDKKTEKARAAHLHVDVINRGKVTKPAHELESLGLNPTIALRHHHRPLRTTQS